MFRSSLRLIATVSLSASLTALGACGELSGPLAQDATDPGTDDTETAVVPSSSGGSGSTTTEEALPTEVSSVLNLPGTPFNYARVALPAHFNTDFVRAQDNTPASNALTDNGATLGRVLFYDTNLSSNRSVACASCHKQSDGFSDTLALSKGFAGSLTGRNSMPISNARYYRSGRFFWDERAQTLEAQVLLPIQNPVEMGLTLAELLERVKAQSYYPYLFSRAFGTPEITTDRISRALAQFVRSIVSYRSKFDAGVAATGNIGANFANYTASENRGKQLFLGQAGCARCHLVGPPPGPPPAAPQNQAVFFINQATNNGLTAGLTTDNGIGDLTGDARDNGRFKSPELRNVARTAPYMHDGSLATLRDVVEHYNTKVQPHPNLDARLRVAGPGSEPRRLNLNAADVNALVDFLGTLTDDALATDAKFANPFKASSL